MSPISQDLVLPLKREYFEQIRDGLKTEEFRLCTPYWAKRLEGRSYNQVILTLGYPAKDDSSRRLALPWRGFVKRKSYIRYLVKSQWKFMQSM